MEQKKITAEELSVLVWLKVLDDYKLEECGEEVTSLSEKVDRFDMDSADMDGDFFYDTIDKLAEYGLLEKDGEEISLTDTAKKISSAVLAMEKAGVTIESTWKEIAEFIRNNKSDIIGIIGVALSALQLIL